MALRKRSVSLPCEIPMELCRDRIQSIYNYIKNKIPTNVKLSEKLSEFSFHIKFNEHVRANIAVPPNMERGYVQLVMIYDDGYDKHIVKIDDLFVCLNSTQLIKKIEELSLIYK